MLPQADQLRPPDAFATLTTLKSPLETFDKQPWVDCPVTHTLGLPLKATRWASIYSRMPNNLALGLLIFFQTISLSRSVSGMSQRL